MCVKYRTKLFTIFFEKSWDLCKIPQYLTPRLIWERNPHSGSSLIQANAHGLTAGKTAIVAQEPKGNPENIRHNFVAKLWRIFFLVKRIGMPYLDAFSAFQKLVLQYFLLITDTVVGRQSSFHDAHAHE